MDRKKSQVRVMRKDRRDVNNEGCVGKENHTGSVDMRKERKPGCVGGVAGCYGREGKEEVEGRQR